MMAIRLRGSRLFQMFETATNVEMTGPKTNQVAVFPRAFPTKHFQTRLLRHLQDEFGFTAGFTRSCGIYGDPDLSLTPI